MAAVKEGGERKDKY